MERFFGGNPLAVAIQLVIISIVAGIVFTALGLDPRDLLAHIPQIIDKVRDFARIFGNSFIEWLFLGALIVVPVWFIVRLFKFMGGDAKH
jgi:hypothetical protein